MMQHLESKTVVGLTILLSCIIGLSLAGKLTPEAVEAIKYIGTAFMTVRLGANVAENLPKKE